MLHPNPDATPGTLEATASAHPSQGKKSAAMKSMGSAG